MANLRVSVGFSVASTKEEVVEATVVVPVVFVDVNGGCVRVCTPGPGPREFCDCVLAELETLRGGNVLACEGQTRTVVCADELGSGSGGSGDGDGDGGDG